MTTYEAVGDVRGPCGHQHRTLRGAVRCQHVDGAGVRRAYPSTYPTRAYSDRVVRRTDGAPLSESEQATLDALYEPAG